MVCHFALYNCCQEQILGSFKLFYQRIGWKWLHKWLTMPQYYEQILFLVFFDKNSGGIFYEDFAKYGFSANRPENDIDLQI